MLNQMYDLVDEAEAILVNKDRNLDDFGRLLDNTWKLKRRTGGLVSTNSIDELYARGIQAGALGGKTFRRWRWWISCVLCSTRETK